MPDTIESRLEALGLNELIAVKDEEDLPFPRNEKRILRLLATAATLFTDQSTEIMALYRDIQEGKVQ